MEVEVSQRSLGTFVPQFLLKFEGNTDLQSYFRQVLKTNYHKGIVQLDYGHCQNCYLALTYKNSPRFKSSQTITRKVHKLLARSANKPLGRYHAYLVKQFLRSSIQVIVKCPSCGHVSKKSIISNDAKLVLKDKLLKSSEAITEPPLSVSKKKKKKRKRKQKDETSGLIIPGSSRDLKSAEEEASTSMDVSPFSPLLPEIFSTPLPRRREVIGTFGTAKTPNTSTPAQAYISKGAFSTPMTGKLSSSLSNFGQTTTQQNRRKGETQSNVKVNKKTKHKQLKEFLSQQTAGVKKPASLADFLSSL